MEGAPESNQNSKKRPRLMLPQDFLDQFSSKKDLISYLREQL